MNVLNEKRVEKALEDLKYLEEELVPCWAEEDHALFLLCEGERYTQETTDKYDNVLLLGMALSHIRKSTELLRSLLKVNAKKMEN